MPNTYDGLQSKWENDSIIDQENKIAVLFGPITQIGWSTVSNWSEFSHGGSVTEGSTNFVESIADAIYEKLPPPYIGL